MRRPDTKESICRLIENLRSAVSDIVLRTTLIVGFPGETDRQFYELIEFIKWAEFDALGCFMFYPESGTLAAGMSSQVPKELKPVPTTIPMMPPKIERVTASVMNWPRIAAGEAPRALRIPISRVRSVTDTSMICD